MPPLQKNTQDTYFFSYIQFNLIDFYEVPFPT